MTTLAEPTTTIAETTTTAAPTPAEDALAAYQAYWAAVNQAFGPPQVDPDAPGLRQYATGEVLAGILERARENLDEGKIGRIPEGARYSHRAEVVSVEGGAATVRDCNINDLVVERVGTGEVIDNAVSTRLYRATLVLEGEQWKVATLEREEGWEGVAGCALE